MVWSAPPSFRCGDSLSHAAELDTTSLLVLLLEEVIIMLKLIHSVHKKSLEFALPSDL